MASWRVRLSAGCLAGSVLVVGTTVEASSQESPAGDEPPLFRDARHAAWSRDGSHLLVSFDFGGDTDIERVSLEGDLLAPLVRRPGYDAVAHAGGLDRPALFQTDRTGRSELAFAIDTVSGDGTDTGRLLDVSFPVMFARWSPDGERVVFNNFALDELRQVHVLDLATGAMTQLTHDTRGHSDYPSWSPDGDWIVFESERTGAWNVYRMWADGSDQTLIPLGDGASAPRLSPDGGTIAFHAVRDGFDYDVFLADTDGSNVRLLAGGPGDQRLPEWSPDGTHLVLVDNAAGHHDVVVVRAADGSSRAVTRPLPSDLFERVRQAGVEETRRYVQELLAEEPGRRIVRDARALEVAAQIAMTSAHRAEARFFLRLGRRLFPDGPWDEVGRSVGLRPH